ncbi:hypothetical protein HZH68_003404 [Vespula germanica]|uniref:Uncharacterized protein n=1 Tax=Vespula germanica TaxID=30212 RepID=A0A834U2Y8_VESGE|nr:hypothetical protein HZH68_003404 [Vespula germanica]
MSVGLKRFSEGSKGFLVSSQGLRRMKVYLESVWEKKVKEEEEEEEEETENISSTLGTSRIKRGCGVNQELGLFMRVEGRIVEREDILLVKHVDDPIGIDELFSKRGGSFMDKIEGDNLRIVRFILKLCLASYVNPWKQRVQWPFANDSPNSSCKRNEWDQRSVCLLEIVGKVQRSPRSTPDGCKTNQRVLARTEDSAGGQRPAVG